MRLDYLQVGDNFTHDELNALVSILLLNEYPVTEAIKLVPSGFKGLFADYYFEYSEDCIAYRETDLQILDNTGELTINCESTFDCSYVISFNGESYSSSDNVITIPLSDFEESLDLIPNLFEVTIEYAKPFIQTVPNASSITKTSELKELINVCDDGATLTIGHNLAHDLNKSILIKKDLNINFSNHSVSSSDVTDSLFKIDNNAKLSISNATFTGFNCLDKGSVFYNRGVLVLNSNSFTDCTALGDGGVIYNDYGEVYATNNTYTGCSGRNGGAIYNKEDEL